MPGDESPYVVPELEQQQVTLARKSKLVAETETMVWVVHTRKVSAVLEIPEKARNVLHIVGYCIT